jgi:hypothetical protein
MATSVVHAERSGDAPVVAGEVGAPAYALCPDERRVAPGQRCTNDAHAGSLDARWRSPSGDYSTSLQAVASLLARGPARAQPDGTVIDTGDLGSALRGVFGKQGGAHWLWYVWGARDSRKLEVNDVGYLDRANQYGTGGELQFRTLQPWAHTLETSTRLTPVWLQNFDDRPTQRTVALTTSARFASFWGLSLGLNAFARRFDDREVGDGAALERAGGGGFTLGLESDPRARVSARFNSSGELVSGGRALRADVTLLLRALPQLDFELDPQLVYARGEPRYAATLGDRTYVFGRLDARSVGAIVRATYTFTPRLTLQAYAQLFLASRHFYDLSTFDARALGPRPAIHLRDLQAGATLPDSNPDTQEGAIDATVVLRWEFRPGSLLYLVYTRSQLPAQALQPGQVGRLDLHAVSRRPASDVVLLKLSYWWG